MTSITTSSAKINKIPSLVRIDLSKMKKIATIIVYIKATIDKIDKIELISASDAQSNQKTNR